MKKFGDNIRDRVLADSAKGLSVREICRRHGIKARSTVFLWRREARAVSPETISLRELQKMKAELQKNPRTIVTKLDESEVFVPGMNSSPPALATSLERALR